MSPDTSRAQPLATIADRAALTPRHVKRLIKLPALDPRDYNLVRDRPLIGEPQDKFRRRDQLASVASDCKTKPGTRPELPQPDHIFLVRRANGVRGNLLRGRVRQDRSQQGKGS